MSVRAAVVKPVRMIVPCYRSNKVIGAKSHISGVVRKGAPPVASICKRIDGRRADYVVPVYAWVEEHGCARPWSKK